MPKGNELLRANASGRNCYASVSCYHLLARSSLKVREVCKWRHLVFILLPPLTSRWKLSYLVMIFNRMDGSALRKLKIWCLCMRLCLVSKQRSWKGLERVVDSALSGSRLFLLCLRSMAGEIISATAWLGQPCPIRIEHWLACFGSRSGESFRKASLAGRGDFLAALPGQTALRNANIKMQTRACWEFREQIKG